MTNTYKNKNNLSRGDFRVPPMIFAILGFDGGDPAKLINALEEYRKNNILKISQV